jgi:hypothetical protein
MPVKFMNAGRCVAHVFAGAVLAAAAAAHAGTVQPEVGFAYGTGAGFGDTHDAGMLQWGVGYYFDNGIGVRALGFGDIDPFQDWEITQRTVSSFVGVQLMDQIPLDTHWSATIGAGMGQTRYNLPTDSTEASSGTDGVVTAGIQWRPGRHYAMSLQYTYLTTSGVAATSLLFQVPF